MISGTERVVILIRSGFVFYIMEPVTESGDSLCFPLCSGHQEVQKQIFGQLLTTDSIGVMSLLLPSCPAFFKLVHSKNLFLL